MADSIDTVYIPNLPTGAASGANYIAQDDGSNTTKVTIENAVAGTNVVSTLNSKWMSEIPNSTNYNNLTTPGTYYVGSAAAAATMTNCPDTGEAHTLLVMYKGSSVTQKTQVVFGANRMWIRSGSSAGFDSWTLMPTRTEVDSLNSNVASKDIAYTSVSGTSQSAIESSLNTLVGTMSDGQIKCIALFGSYSGSMTAGARTVAFVYRINSGTYWCIPIVKNALQGYYYSSAWHWS